MGLYSAAAGLAASLPKRETPRHFGRCSLRPCYSTHNKHLAVPGWISSDRDRGTSAVNPNTCQRRPVQACCPQNGSTRLAASRRHNNLEPVTKDHSFDPVI